MQKFPSAQGANRLEFSKRESAESHAWRAESRYRDIGRVKSAFPAVFCHPWILGKFSHTGARTASTRREGYF